MVQVLLLIVTQPTPAVISSVKMKTMTYQGMLKIASDQRDAALHNHVPQVMSCVISHEGEFSEPLIKTIETLTTHLNHHVQSHTEYFQTGE